MPSDRAVPIDLDGERGSLEAFSALDEVADRARVAFVGEMDHFITEKYEYRLLCIRYLVSRGWRWFGEELPADRGRRADAYLRTGEESQLEPLDEPPWFTSGILANDRQPDAALDVAQRRFMQAVRRACPGIRWFGFDADATNRDYLALANAASTYEALRPALALREHIMQAKVAEVVAAHPREKVALIAAAAHLLKDDHAASCPEMVAGPGGGTARSLGHHVTHVLSPGPVLSLWLLHGEGTSDNPWIPPPGRSEPAAGTFDRELLDRIGRPCFVPANDDRERSVTQMHDLVLRCRFSEQVDGIVFAPKVHPLGRWSQTGGHR